MLDKSIAGDECIVLPSELLDELLVLIELLQIICRHGIDAVMLSSIDVMLVAEDTVSSMP